MSASLTWISNVNDLSALRRTDSTTTVRHDGQNTKPRTQRSGVGQLELEDNDDHMSFILSREKTVGLCSNELIVATQRQKQKVVADVSVACQKKSLNNEKKNSRLTTVALK